MIKLLIGVVAAAVITICVFMFIDPNMATQTAQTSQTVLTSSNISNLADFNVTVEGEVAKPGTYTLSEGAVMEDLIEAAGGLNEYADELAFFTDASLTKGKTYYIASKYDTSNVCSVTEITKVNINLDDAETLRTISNFTTSVANSIISYRTEHGRFNTIEDLLDVYGIGNATYRKVRGFVTLHT